MAFVYSKRFADGGVAAGGNPVIYTCPPGKTSVVVDMSITPNDPPSTLFLVQLNGSAVLFGGPGGTQYETMRWRGRVVLTPGDTLNFWALSGAWGFIVSGYELG